MRDLRAPLVRVLCLTFFAVACGLDVSAQTPLPLPAWDRLVSGDFTAAYERGRDLAAAKALLADDPFSLAAVSLLVHARRWDEAIDLVERIGHARSDLV
ncbi:MAG TPA: hypothetical protein VLV86_18960, partial [Vicinamibacterales bacterium]|nr:hypothetical protein [Vicinamibacterales bacterium]